MKEFSLFGDLFFLLYNNKTERKKKKIKRFVLARTLRTKQTLRAP